MKVVIFTVILDSVILDIWLIRMIRPVKLCQNQYYFEIAEKHQPIAKKKTEDKSIQVQESALILLSYSGLGIDIKKRAGQIYFIAPDRARN